MSILTTSHPTQFPEITSWWWWWRILTTDYLHEEDSPMGELPYMRGISKGSFHVFMRKFEELQTPNG